ncbi:MAG: branched-chain amino acid transport system permease protein [Actinomycetota bacterium]|jgi:branched-chain amino acid transport system permease protein|nr:branched-chain amino acid transport system permease protein [Actinomycetota bacterium]
MLRPTGASIGDQPELVSTTTGGVLVRKRVALFLAVLVSAGVCLFGVGAGPAQAAGESIFGFLFQLKGNVRTSYPSVVVTAKGPGGFTGKAVSDKNGRWTIEVPRPGTFTVSIDTKTLPKGVTLTDPSKQTLKLPVLEGQDKPVLFPLGKSTRTIESKWSQALQLTAEGLRFGLIIALAAVGLSLIFGTTGLTNFAHGELVTLGAVSTWWISTGVLPLLPDFGGLQFFPAAALALLLCAAMGWVNDVVLWRPLRRRGTGLIAAMIVSIGLSIFLRYFYLYLFTGSNRSYPDYQSQRGLNFLGVDLAPKDYWSMAVAVVVLGGVIYALVRTRTGKATRAVADNPALAAASGIDVDRVIRVVWVAGATLAGLAGILLGLAQGVNFQMGFQILLLIFAAVTLGGLGTAYGALVGSIVVGLFVSVSTLWIPVELKNVGALGILIVILLVRPQGILGRAQRVG